VNNTAEIGVFKIISESGVAAGVRRIEAVAGPAILEYLNVRESVVKDLSDRFKVKPEEITDRISAMQTELKDNQKQIAALKSQLAVAGSLQLMAQAESMGGSSPEPGKVNFVAAFSPEAVKKGLQAGKVIGAVAKICGGGGGGRPNFAQAGGKDDSKLGEAIAEAKALVTAGLG
jgi:alanyl-tRNA synthetase